MKKTLTKIEREIVLRNREREADKFTLAQAFDYFDIPDESEPSTCGINEERAARSVGFLLEWLSSHGNESVNGFAAHGLARSSIS